MHGADSTSCIRQTKGDPFVSIGGGSIFLSLSYHNMPLYTDCIYNPHLTATSKHQLLKGILGTVFHQKRRGMRREQSADSDVNNKTNKRWDLSAEHITLKFSQEDLLLRWEYVRITDER